MEWKIFPFLPREYGISSFLPNGIGNFVCLIGKQNFVISSNVNRTFSFSRFFIQFNEQAILRS